MEKERDKMKQEKEEYEQLYNAQKALLTNAKNDISFKAEAIKQLEEEKRILSNDNFQLRKEQQELKDKQTKAMDQIRTLHEEKAELEKSLRNGDRQPGDSTTPPQQPQTSAGPSTVTTIIKTEPRENAPLSLETQLRLAKEECAREKEKLKRSERNYKGLVNKYNLKKELIQLRERELAMAKRELRQARGETINIELVTIEDDGDN